MSYITYAEYVPLNNKQTTRDVTTADAVKQFADTVNNTIQGGAKTNERITSLVPVQEDGTTIGFIVTFVQE